MATRCAGLDVYTEKEVERLNALGEKMKISVEDVLKSHGASKARMYISGKGSMLAINFPWINGKPLLAVFWHHMLKNGTNLAPRGFIAMNLELKPEHIEEFVAATEFFVVNFKEAMG